jgi:Xaa-Pro aminopeptidase
VTGRLDRARALLEELRLDVLLVSHSHDVRYLSGFRGDDAMLLIGRELALICTDARYWTQVAEEVGAFELERTERLLEDAAAAAARRVGAAAALGFQGGSLTYGDYRTLRRRHRGRLRNTGPQLGRLRAVKDAHEIAIMRRAASVTDASLEAALARGLVGRREDEVAWTIAEEMHARGAEAVAFDTIVAAGERGALAHAIPGERCIAAGEFVVIDTGARVNGYCSDITRTFAAGRVSDEEARIYDVVLRAQRAGLAALHPGAHGRDGVDAAARAVIATAGFGEHFGHGTGHGVGLEVHEAPALGRLRGDVLEDGMVCTIEPGIYIAGRLGVRIEDTVLVTADGCEQLTRSPRELRVVD